MKRIFCIFVIMMSCTSLSIIEKEKEFLENNSGISKNELIKYLGEPNDSMPFRNGIVFIWDNLNGKMTRMTAPPYTSLDSAKWFGKRQIQTLLDSNGKMIEYKYWDFTNPKDFEKFIRDK